MRETEIISNIPPPFICPISLDLFKDPVTLCTGQTYDRSSIEKWIAAGNVTCPVTMQKLDDLSLVPNHTLGHLIDQWVQERSQCHVISSSPGYIIEENHDFGGSSSMAELKRGLVSPEFTTEEKIQTLERILILADELPEENFLLIQFNFFGIIVEQVFWHPGLHIALYSSEADMRFAEKALACALKLLPFSDVRSLNHLKEESPLENFLALLGRGNAKIKTRLCDLVEVISLSPETQELCRILGKSLKFLQESIRLLHQGEPEASEAGIRAISALSLSESNLEALVREAAVEGLIKYITTNADIDDKHDKMRRPVVITMALETIERLLTVEIARGNILNHPGGIGSLVKMVFRVSDDHRGSESAVNCLLNLCGNSVLAREEAICGGVMTQLLLLLQSQCEERTKSRARMLLRLLKSMWAEGSKRATSTKS